MEVSSSAPGRVSLGRASLVGLSTFQSPLRGRQPISGALGGDVGALQCGLCFLACGPLEAAPWHGGGGLGRSVREGARATDSQRPLLTRLLSGPRRSCLCG